MKYTYREAYDLIIQAYFRNEIMPFDPRFCFCGTLCPVKKQWTRFLPKVALPYTYEEYGRMERALFQGIDKNIMPRSNGLLDFDSFKLAINIIELLDYEDCLFNGMCKALEVLKDIHRERGEDVDSLPALTKREMDPMPDVPYPN